MGGRGPKVYSSADMVDPATYCFTDSSIDPGLRSEGFLQHVAPMIPWVNWSRCYGALRFRFTKGCFKVSFQ